MTNSKTFLYIRVSSKEQNEARQLEAMKAEGIEEHDIFIDKESGKDFNRPQYITMKDRLRKGDLLIIQSIDRFGRNSNEIQNEWKDITQRIGADIKVIDMPLLDTTQYRDQLGTFVSDLVLQVLAFMAERERDNIRSRQKEGIAIARKQGKHLGRPQLNLQTLTKKQKQDLQSNYQSWKDKELTGVAFMELLELKKNSFYKIIKEYEVAQ